MLTGSHPQYLESSPESPLHFTDTFGSSGIVYESCPNQTFNFKNTNCGGKKARIFIPSVINNAVERLRTYSMQKKTHTDLTVNIRQKLELYAGHGEDFFRYHIEVDFLMGFRGETAGILPVLGECLQACHTVSDVRCGNIDRVCSCSFSDASS